MLTDEELAEKLRAALHQCSGFDGDMNSQARKEAFDYYFQRPLDGDEDLKGRSNVVSGDLSAMVEATLAQMMEAYSGQQIGEFPPLGIEDEEQALLESEAVQYFVMGKENGFIQLTMAIKEALLCRNGQIVVEAQDRTERKTRKLSRVEPEAYAVLKEGPGVVDARYDAQKQELFLTTEREVREFVMQSLPGENFLYFKTWYKPDLEGIPICAVRHVESRAYLQSLGVPKEKVDQLRPYRQELIASNLTRNPNNETAAEIPVDKSQEQIEWFDVFVRLEVRDGVDELRRVRFGHREALVLDNKPWPFINIAAGTAIMNPHRFTGISLYDKLKQIQDIRTQLRRALLDNVNATSKNRTASLDGAANDDDLTDGRVNNNVRIKPVVDDVRRAIMAFQIPDTSGNILSNLESTGRERSEMGGSALDLQSAQMQIGGDRMGSQGLDRAYSVAEQLTASMMKTVSGTLIRSLFLVAHKVLREHFDEPLPIKRNGKWQYVTPSDWPERNEVIIKPGMSPGERQRKIAAMTDVINRQMMLAEQGMDEVLVDVEGFYRACMDLDRMAEIQNPEQYYVDPGSDQAKAALENKAKRAEEEKMTRAALMQQSFGMKQMELALNKFIHDSELQFKYFAELMSGEKVEAEQAGRAAIELLKTNRGANDGGRIEGSDGAGSAASGSREAAGE